MCPILFLVKLFVLNYAFQVGAAWLQNQRRIKGGRNITATHHLLKRRSHLRFCYSDFWQTLPLMPIYTVELKECVYRGDLEVAQKICEPGTPVERVLPLMQSLFWISVLYYELFHCRKIHRENHSRLAHLASWNHEPSLTSTPPSICIFAWNFIVD